MTWGTFGAVHILSLLASAAIIAILYALLINKTQKTQIAVLGVLSFAGVAAIIFNLLAWNSPLEYLPLHLCSMTALVLPVAVFTRSRRLNNLLILWGLGALMALVVNHAQAHFEVLSWTFFFYYVPHTLEFGVVVLMFLLHLARADARCIPSTMGITAAAYTLAHLCNVWINGYCQAHHILNSAGEVLQVNYMFSIVPENPVLQLIFTRPYWYMFGVLPVILLYLCLVYNRQLRQYFKNRKGKLHD